MDTINQLVKKQKEYFDTLITQDYDFRINQLEKLYQVIDKYQVEIEEALFKDLGKSKLEAYSTEIGFVLKSIKHTNKHLQKWIKPTTKLAPYYLIGSYDKIYYRPLGTSLIIGPFNYPFQLVIEPLIGAIMAGNTAIIKPSELAGNTAKIVAQMIQETFDEKYIACILGDVNTTIKLTHSDVDHIFFTGSIPVGKEIMKVASEKLVPVTLELGGKSPVIVDSSANLKDAVEKIAWGKILNVGQTCIAPDYLIIKEDLKAEFIKLWQETVAIFLSDDYGKIINVRHFNRLVSLLEGEEVYSGGNYDPDKLFIEPTLVNGVDSKLMNEEIFGPILPILTYNNIDEIIAMVELHPNPLALYIFSNNKELINYLTTRLSFGGACINDCISHLISPRVPFGGVRYSGMGQYHGKYSLRAFSHLQTIHYRFFKKDFVSLYPPYSNKLYQLVKKIMK